MTNNLLSQEVRTVLNGPTSKPSFAHAKTPCFASLSLYSHCCARLNVESNTGKPVARTFRSPSVDGGTHFVQATSAPYFVAALACKWEVHEETQAAFQST